jgi:hypothetical protein
VNAFAKDIPDDIADEDHEAVKEWKARYKNDPQFIMECEARYELWCKEVLQDWEEKSEFNSDAQMDRFKSRMLRGMQNSVMPATRCIKCNHRWPRKFSHSKIKFSSCFKN